VDKNQEAAALFNKHAKAYEEKFMDLALYNETYDTFCAWVANKNARILDIGCGPGNITRYLLASNPGWRILGIDLAPNMIRLAEANNPAARFRVMDGREIAQLSETFDGIVAGFCMPYFSKNECIRLISDAARLLETGGCLYFSAIEGSNAGSRYETASNGIDKAFVYRHEEGYLAEAVAQNGMEVKSLSRLTYPAREGEVQQHLVFTCKKQK
jgi:predicted TPR repeat methyltransferase